MDRSESSAGQPFSPPRHGVTLHRALEPGRISRSAFHDPGVFGRMFPALPAAEFEPATLARLAEAMLDDSAGTDNPAMPAGFTFLGQFVDHDITFDPTSSLERQNDPEAIHNFRTPYLELDSVYGAGPSVQPFLYDREDRDKLLIGVDSDGGPNDLPRNRQGVALTGDPRNDENLIVSQLHLAFLKLHNRVVAGIRNGTIAAEPGEPVFEAAQRLVRWHYQWIVAHEFLPMILGATLWQELAEPVFFRWKGEPFIPVEFAVAAYRFGHSQVRAKYRINEAAGVLPIFPDLAVGPNLTAARVLRADRTVDLRHFFDGSLLGKKIDSVLSGPLGKLPGGGGSLPLRNLQRGVAFGLPSGQRVAKALGLEPLTDDQLRIKGERILPPGKAPLWYYILKEAEVLANGEHLGPVGGRIVGEVLLGLLQADARSYLNQDPLWQPSLGAAMADLVAFTGTPHLVLAGAA